MRREDFVFEAQTPKFLQNLQPEEPKCRTPALRKAKEIDEEDLPTIVELPDSKPSNSSKIHSISNSGSKIKSNSNTKSQSKNKSNSKSQSKNKSNDSQSNTHNLNADTSIKKKPRIALSFE